MALDSFFAALSSVANLGMLGVIFGATIVGVVVGALPGLGSVMALALLLPFSLALGPAYGVAMMASLFCAATYGGSITAILINAPGTPGAAATTFDGYPLAVKGEAGRALGMAAVSSAIGGILSLVVLIVAAPMLARVAYSFGPPEYFALALFGLSMVATISTGSSIKNLIGGTFGVLIATVGIDFATGAARFTFGIPELTEGISFVPAMIGLFAGAELLKQAGMLHIKYERVAEVAVKLPSLADFRKVAVTILRSSGIGTLVGIMPGGGATMASMLGYSEAKRWSRNKDEFGKGAIEGIAAPEAANNAATGGAMVPTLALGIPGSAATAVILGGMYMHGIRPGYYLFTENPQVLYTIFFSMLAANILFLGVGTLGAKVFARISLVPRTFLWPTVLILSVVGSFALRQSMYDVAFMFGFSVIGFAMARYGFSAAPVIMGLVLGNLLENSLKQSLIIFERNFLLFFERPIAVVLFLITIAGLMGGPILGWLRKRNR